MNKLRLVIILQLALFAGWAGWLFYFSSRTAAEFCLNTVPVDPRDLMGGTYLALSYDISAPKGTDCAAAVGAGFNGRVYVQLGPDGTTVKDGDSELPVYAALACSALAPEPDGKIWASGTSGWRFGQRHVTYGIEKFFINENDPLKNSKSGEFAARVKLDKLGRLHLAGLIKK